MQGVRFLDDNGVGAEAHDADSELMLEVSLFNRWCIVDPVKISSGVFPLSTYVAICAYGLQRASLFDELRELIMTIGQPLLPGIVRPLDG